MGFRTTSKAVMDELKWMNVFHTPIQYEFMPLNFLQVPKDLKGKTI